MNNILVNARENLMSFEYHKKMHFLIYLYYVQVKSQ